MSAYHELQTQYKDQESLVKALADMGYTTVEQHEVAQALYGYHGDKRAEKANVIVRRQYVGSAANDLGFVKREDGTFGAIVSEFDSRKHNADWMRNLKKSYTEHVGIKTAAKSGLKFLGKKVVNGKVQLQWLDTRTK